MSLFDFIFRRTRRAAAPTAAAASIERPAPSPAPASASRPPDALLDPLLRDIRSTIPEVWDGAMTRLATLGTRAVDHLGDLAADPDWRVRARAVNTLGKIGGERAVAAVTTFLNDSHATPRSGAVEVLGTIGDARTISVLQPLVRDHEEFIRNWAQGAIDRLSKARPAPTKPQGSRFKTCRSCSKQVRLQDLSCWSCGATGAAAFDMSGAAPSVPHQRLDSTPQPSSATPASAAELACKECSVKLTGYHYDFESIRMTNALGGQCRDCGTVLCDAHYSRWATRDGKKWCPHCGGKAEWLSTGPAYSSMVDQQRRAGKYNSHIRPPEGRRSVVVE